MSEPTNEQILKPLIGTMNYVYVNQALRAKDQKLSELQAENERLQGAFETAEVQHGLEVSALEAELKEAKETQIKFYVYEGSNLEAEMLNKLEKSLREKTEDYVRATTLVACKELNRNGIGIEISEKYCEIAKKRLKATCKPLFTDVSSVKKNTQINEKQLDTLFPAA